MNPNAPSSKERSWLRRPPVLLVALVLAAAAVIIVVVWPRPKEAATAYYEVKRGDFTVTVLDRGTLAAVSEVSIRNEVEGTARIIYIVPEGSYVRKGDLLVELDSSQALDQVNLQQINFEKAKFALAQAEAQLEIQKSATNSDIRAADLKVKFAKMDVDKFYEGQKVVDMIEASNRVVQALAQLAVNRENFTWTTNLASKGYETKQKVDVDRLAVMNNENSLVVANNTLLMLQKFDLPKQAEKFQSDYEEAQKELERVIAQSERKIAQYQADLVSQSNTLVLNEKKLQRDRKNLKATRVEAPQDGLVVYAMTENRFSSESLIEEGAVVRNRQELIKLPDTSKMKLTIKVHESHVGLVQAGQPAFVKLDSVPDQRFAAVVHKVALLPDSQSRFGNPNLKVYNTEVVVTDPLPGIKPGVSGQAEIIITNITDALTVPLQAVTTLKGRQVVYVRQGSKDVPTPVDVGMFNTRFIEILSGLKEGDRVLLSPPFDTQEKDLEGSVLSPEEKARAATNAPARTGPPPSSRGPETNSPSTQVRPGTSPRPDELPDTAPGDLSSPQVAMSSSPSGSEARPALPMQPPAEVIKQFDSDGDGELNADEQAAMRKAMQARFGRSGRSRPNREELVKRFDKNGDGKLDEEESAAMRQAMASRSGSGRSDRPDRRAGAPEQAADTARSKSELPAEQGQ